LVNAFIAYNFGSGTNINCGFVQKEKAGIFTLHLIADLKAKTFKNL